MAQLINNKKKRNYIINGNFDFWQRGVGPITFGYLADRFQSTGSVEAYSLGAFLDPGSNNYASISRATAGSVAVELFYRMEATDAKRLEGKTVTLSYLARRPVGANPFTLRLFEANAVNDFSGVTKVGDTLTFGNPDTTVWNRFSISFIVTANMASRGFQLNMGNESAGAIDFDIAQVMLNEGAVAAPFQTAGANAQDELAMCQRYYETSLSGLNYYNFAQGSASQLQRQTIGFTTIKRQSPTVIVTRTGGSVGTVAAVGNQSANEILAVFTGNAGEIVEFTWTANAEL